jgi:protein-S-isoprenylcysteine O-methyltransferase Ste14
MPALVWDLKQAWIALALEATYWIGWAIVLISAASMDHAELFGLKQTLQFQKGQPITEQPFREPPAYTLVRHPMMLGMIVAFWSTPVMSEGRLLFAAAFTVYILVAIRWEEKDLRERHGDAYIEYAKRVPAFIPWPRP